jgi:hypothetical protein
LVPDTLVVVAGVAAWQWVLAEVGFFKFFFVFVCVCGWQWFMERGGGRSGSGLLRVVPLDSWDQGGHFGI